VFLFINFQIFRIRGIKEELIQGIVDAIVEIIDIKHHANRQIKAYSGGNKRRLSLGMALVGMPPVLVSRLKFFVA
jgi:ATP-binding cassette subfamily A (ABC1) protein 3